MARIYPASTGVVSFIILFLSLGCVSSTIPSTNEVNLENVMHSINVYDGVLKFPVPTWAQDKKSDAFETSRNETAQSFHLEFIPQGEQFESWSRMFGIYGWRLEDYSLDRLYEVTVIALEARCSTKADISFNRENKAIFMVYNCPQIYSRTNTKISENAVFYLSRVNSSFVRIYMAWRENAADRPEFNAYTLERAITDMEKITYKKR